MRLFRIGAIVLFILLVCYLIFKDPPQEVSINDQGNVTSGDIYAMPKMFLTYIVTAVLGGFLFVTYILPKFGDAVSEAVISSGEEAAPDPYQKARAQMAIGNYEEAINVFRDISKEEPNDRRPLAEITNIYVDRLHDPDNAILTAENAAAQDWEDDEDTAYFMFRVVDLIHTHREDDEARASEILQEIIQRFPDSRHSANATHKLREIDPALLSALFDDGPAAPAVPGVPAPDGPPAPDEPPRPTA